MSVRSKRVKVYMGGCPIYIRTTDLAVDHTEDQDANGLYYANDSGETCIDINQGITSPAVFADVLLHELMHGADEHYGLELSHLQIHVISMALSQAIGPWVHAPAALIPPALKGSGGSSG